MYLSEMNLFVCTKCFGLTSKGESTQCCNCEKKPKVDGLDCPSGIHLCYICSIYPAGGTSRWSWEACETCLAANSFLRTTRDVGLKLGRHSLMNGLKFSLNLNNMEQERAAQELLTLANELKLLETTGAMRARRLFTSIASWKNLGNIPLRVWVRAFKLRDDEGFSYAISNIYEALDCK